MKTVMWWNWLHDWWERLRGNERLSLIFEAVIVLATTCYAIIALLQWQSMRQSNGLTREALESVQRAFVVYTDLGALGYRDLKNNNQMTFLVHPIWENSGNTPTRDLHIFVSEPKPTQPPYKNLDFSQPKDTVFTPMFIPPHGVVRGGERAISLSDLLGLRKGKKTIYVWGWATYRDIFPNTALHVTRFCTVLTGAIFDPNDFTKPIAILNEFCPTYNCADEECKKQGQGEH